MNTTDLSIKMVIDRWNGSILNLNRHLNALSDEQLQKEVAPGKNRGTYILGHLIAVHDDMIVLLDLGEKLYPQLHEPFLKLADKATNEIPSAAELRAFWNIHCEVLQQKFGKMQAEQWFEKHTAVTQEDFEKEPHRNKLNIIITRTSHLQYHTGQLVLLN
jgi:DinB superfamily